MFHDAESDGAVLLLTRPIAFCRIGGRVAQPRSQRSQRVAAGVEHFRGVFILHHQPDRATGSGVITAFLPSAGVPPLTLAQRESLFVEQACRATPTCSYRPCKTACKRSITCVWVILLRMQQQVELLRAALDPAEFWSSLRLNTGLNPRFGRRVPSVLS